MIAKPMMVLFFELPRLQRCTADFQVTQIGNLYTVCHNLCIMSLKKSQQNEGFEIKRKIVPSF